MKPTENYGYQIKSYRFVGEDKFEVYLKGVKIPGVFDTYLQAEQYCKDEIINDAADKYVFVEADHNSKWSNNNDTAGDNFGSFKAGANWAISQMQPEWVACDERLPEESGQVLGIMKDTLDIYVCHYKPSRKLFLVYGAGADPISDMKLKTIN